MRANRSHTPTESILVTLLHPGDRIAVYSGRRTGERIVTVRRVLTFGEYVSIQTSGGYVRVPSWGTVEKAL